MNKIENIIKNYQTEHPHGFDHEEIEEILNNFETIDIDRFNESLFESTCLMVEGKILTYGCDIIEAIKESI